MAGCTRAQAIELGEGYSLMLFGGQEALPSPHSHAFEFPGDQQKFAPDRPADVEHVKLDIALDFEQETVKGTAYTTFRVLFEEVRTISLDAEELNIERVAIENGPELSYTLTPRKLIVTLDRAYKHGEHFTVAVTYNAKPRIGLHFMKPVAEDPTRPVHAFTFGQPRYHSHWFPCHDSPDDRATTEILATVPAQFITVSNGNLLEVIDNGATKTHHWRHDVPHAAYLVSLVVGDFAEIKDEYKGKPVTYYVRKDRTEDVPFFMGKTPDMMKFYSEFTGVEYPYDKYAQTVVEIYTGAMEHTTATTHSFTLLPDAKARLDIGHNLVSVVAHELAHQWFGDLVTCRDWSNAWLNEGFATYFDNLYIQHDKGDDEFKYQMLQEKKGYLTEDGQYRRPIVYYVYHDRGFELFDRHLYNKGNWVLHMLRHQLGQESFRRGLHEYLERYRTKQVVTADLMRTLEEVTGHSLEQFFQQWVHGGGHPDLDVNYSWDAERKLAKLKIKQTQKVDELTACFYTPLDIAFTVPTSDEAARDEHTQQIQILSYQVQLGEDGQTEQSFYFPLEREPLMIKIDPDGWLLKTLKFERAARALRYQLAHDNDVLGRIEAAEELSKNNGDTHVEVLATALNTDPFWGVREAAAVALGKIGTEKAQEILIKALQEINPTQFSRVRSAIAAALGEFQQPAMPSLAQRSAEALRTVLERGDVSYLVETGAAEALGKTRVEGNVDFLKKLIDRPSWTNVVQRAIFSGLGAGGEDQVVDFIAGYALNGENHVTLRRAAIMGLVTVASNRYLYSESAQKRALKALVTAVEHDSWGPARSLAAVGLRRFGDASVAGKLEDLAATELDSGVQRNYLVAARALRQGTKDGEQFKQLRDDLDTVREENRKLRDQLSEILTRLK
ncbi:aminopeptidase [Ktedonobacteria bacterium brp13]|nr:aminopeptidase [Ktedonobacteria bacterium brp13]